MNFELVIALRYLLAKRQQAFISVISLISVMGVGLGVASLIVVLGVMNGFSQDLRDKILGVNAHLIIGGIGGNLKEPERAMESISGLAGVEGVTPFIYSEVMLSTEYGVKGVVLRGLDPSTAVKVLSIERDMVAGDLGGLSAPGGPPRIVVGDELASRLGLRVGSLVNLLSPSGSRSAAGFTPKVKIFRVAGVFRTGMYEYDSSLGYVALDAARDLLGYSADAVTGLEVRLTDVDAAPEVAKSVRGLLEGEAYVRTWMDMNENLFAALKLEKTAMFIILALIVLVGSFSIITTLVMLVMEKTKDIAILMSMGASAKNIRNIFMLQGTIIGAVGTALGFALGIPASLLLKRYQFIELPRDVYSLDHLPVLLEWQDLMLIGVAAFALCFLATLYPARQASRLQPAEALRYE